MEFNGLDCKKCTYFDNKKKATHKTLTVVGFCKVRQKYVTDQSITNNLCKDKAVVGTEKFEEIKQRAIEIESKFRTNPRDENRRFVTF